jgi:predicted transcriptional regulator
MDDVVRSRRFTTYPVVDDGHAVGLLPFRRVAEIPRREWDERAVRDSMLRLDQVPVLTSEERLLDALEKLDASEVNRALVVDDGRLVGLLSATDLARAFELAGSRRR